MNKKINLKELMQFYIEFYLDQIDHELRQAFMRTKQLQLNSNEFLIKIKECLRMSLNMSTEKLNFVSEQLLDFTSLKQIIFLFVNEDLRNQVEENKQN